MIGLSFFVKNFANLISFLFPLFDKLPSKLLPEKMVSLVSRTGRNLQRYDRGCRQVAGCIPYRYKKSDDDPSSMDKAETCCEEIEVLVISAQNGKGMLFPKGGWEQDESMEEAAIRETLEEAGVIGNVESELGKWVYMSKRGGIMHEGYMYPMLVQKQLDIWPEKNIRNRRWVSIKEAREVCQNWWMREALEELVRRRQVNSRPGAAAATTKL